MMTSAKEAVMRTKWMQTALLLAGLAAMCGTAAYAQTDVAASLYGTFTGTASGATFPGTGTIQSPSNAPGGLLEVRHIASSGVGFEGAYAYNRAKQVYSYSDPSSSYCSVGGGGDCTSETLSANAHELTGDLVGSLKAARFRPFALAGVGILFDVPTSGQATVTNLNCSGGVPSCVLSTGTVSTSTSARPVFVYGAGVDWKLLPHIGMRLQYRGNFYKALDLSGPPSIAAFTHAAEPIIGVYFRL